MANQIQKLIKNSKWTEKEFLQGLKMTQKEFEMALDKPMDKFALTHYIILAIMLKVEMYDVIMMAMETDPRNMKALQLKFLRDNFF